MNRPAVYPLPLIVFDGYCILCSRLIKMIIRFDPKGLFHFIAGDQVDFGSLPDCEKLVRPIHSVVLVDGQGCYERSAAIIRIGKKLRYVAWAFYLAELIPEDWLNVLYDWIAKNRYRWFGRRDRCMIPAQKYRNRFL